MLGMLSLVCLIVGNMIGIGLYVGSFYSMLSLQDARLVLLVWFVGGLYALCGAIAYGAVAQRLPVSGGEYTYLSRCVHPAIGFIAGWISIIAGFTAPIAGAALLFGEYLNRFLGEGYSDRVRIFASLAIVAAAALHLLHVKVGAGFNNVVIGVKLVCFLVFLAIGVPFAMRSGYSGLLVDPTASVPESLSFANRLMDGKTVYNMIISLFYISLAYTGFNASIYLAGEIDREPNTKNGQSLVSRSMWMACLLVMIFYLLLNFVFLFGLDAQSIVDGGESYVALVANNIGGPSLSILIQITIILSAATSILAMMATGPMVYAQMAKDGYLPKWLEATNQVPRFPILIQSTLCCVLVWISEIKDIVGYLGLTLTACGALAVSSIWFAKNAFQENLPVRWYEHACTAIYVSGAVLFLMVAAFSQREFNQFLLCMASFAAGLFIYVLVKWL
jgi:APA family basic amino acid/polyamine antiporter